VASTAYHPQMDGKTEDSQPGVEAIPLALWPTSGWLVWLAGHSPVCLQQWVHVGNVQVYKTCTGHGYSSDGYECGVWIFLLWATKWARNEPKWFSIDVSYESNHELGVFWPYSSILTHFGWFLMFEQVTHTGHGYRSPWVQVAGTARDTGVYSCIA